MGHIRFSLHTITTAGTFSAIDYSHTTSIWRHDKENVARLDYFLRSGRTMSSSIQSLATLLNRTNIEDHVEILEAANNNLKSAKGDLEAQHVRAIALLKLDRYEDAVKAIEAGGDRLKEKAQLELAYALYKSGKPEEAAKVASQGDGRGFEHVEAQASYRDEDFRRAAELYQELARNPQEDADLDLRINAGAVDAQLEWSGQGHNAKKRKSQREDLEAFETAYNAACQSIARGELTQAEVLLRRARDLCSSMEDMSDEDKQNELLPIGVQQIYVLVRLGELEEAARLSKGLDMKSVSDRSTRHIAQVNSVAASAEYANPFMSQRLISKDLDSFKPDYPFKFQASALDRNRYAADLQSLKFDGTVASTSRILAQYTDPSADALYNNLSVVNAAAHARYATGKEAIKHILPVLSKRPNDVGLILTIVQLYVLTGNSASAIVLLEGFMSRLENSGNAADLDVRFAPGLVGALTSLYQSQRRKGQGQLEVAKAATHWRRKSKESPLGASYLLKAAGGALLQSDEPEHKKLATEIFTDLHQSDRSDHYATAGMLAASPETAGSELSAALTPIDQLIKGIDIDALEKAGIAQPLPAAGAAVITRKRPAEETKIKRPKKIRKSRLPKDYDPNKKPDPERWLPLRDRSSYRPKGKKGKARANLLSQGAAPSGDSDGSRPGTPGGEIVKGKQAQAGGGGGKKKKKGKGGKW